jgi:hypothetical protein
MSTAVISIPSRKNPVGVHVAARAAEGTRQSADSDASVSREKYCPMGSS